MSGSVTMYTTPWCGYCHRLKGQMDREGIAYEVVDIEQHPEAAEIVERSTTATRPCRRWSTPTARADEPVADPGQGEAGRAGDGLSDASPREPLTTSPAAGRRTSARPATG